MTQTSWNRTLLAAGVVGAALLAEHAIFYDEQAMKDEPELTLFASNILGTATIAAGMLLARSAEEAAHHLVIAGVAGTVVLSVRIARRALRKQREIGRIANQAIGLGRGARHYGQSYSGPDGAAGRDGASYRRTA